MMRIMMPLALLFLFALSFAMASPYATKVPLYQSGNIIYIEATVNKKRGFYVIDTGYRGILLNNRHFHGKASDRLLVGVTGYGDQFLETNRVGLRIGSLDRIGLNAEIGNLQHLEKRIGIQILGLIGSTFFKRLEVVLDYANREMTLYRLDKHGHRLDSSWEEGSPSQTLPFQFKGHLPVISIPMGLTVLRLGLDSGAESNLFDLKTMPGISAFLRNHRTTTVAGLGGGVLQAPVAMLIHFRIGDLSYRPMRTLFIDLKVFQRHLPHGALDGILGHSFLHQCKIGINCKRKEIYFWDNRPESEAAPDLISKELVKKGLRLQLPPKM